MTNLSAEAARYIDSHRVARLATADAQALPHVVPICYGRIGRRIYFVCDEKPKRHGPRALKRLSNLSANPRAALLIDDYDDNWRRLAFLLLQTEARPVRRPSEYRAALALLRRRYPPYRRMALDLESNPMVRLTVTRWHLWRIDRPGPPTRDRFAKRPRKRR